MPEIRRVFSAGRMNKDIDERLLHPGEYRDALNVGVGNSEGSDVGAVENLRGNQLIGAGGAGGEVVQGEGIVESPYSFTNAITVGAIRYDLEEKVYWFISSDEGSFILEYDQTIDIVNTVLADRSNILNFSSDYLITGINVLGGQLFWTDNQTEPKKINIEKFKEGSVSSNNNIPSHTQVFGRDFVEADITVIKKSPLNSPEVTALETIRPDAGTFNVTATANLSTVIVGGNVNLDVSTTNHAYIEGDNIRISTTSGGEDISATATITRVVGIRITATINTITNVDGTGSLLYNIDILGNEVLFELKFPRFSYRWKYADGEYSVYSPFSEVAFIPGSFEYNSEQGYNLGMTNNIRQVVVGGFDQAPDDVVEIDLLYKESNSATVYSVETIDVSQESVEINNDQIHAILPENQLLRPYDNVPKIAKSQEVVANRLVYGNYVHNYDVDDEPDFTVGIMGRNNNTIQSIKTNRNYQLGVVYQDQYGRQTPVLSNTTGSHRVDVNTSDESTEFSVKLNNNAPDWATDYKFYVKETATEYYNLALDRYYTGEDGFVWCSFPSSEFNKINEDSYLILKKQHSAGGAVKDGDARFKVLDIRTEAPDFLTRQEEVVINITYDSDTGTPSVPDGTTDPPVVPTVLAGDGGIRFTWVVNPDSSFYSQIRRGNSVRWSDGTDSTGQYEIQDVTDTASTDGWVEVVVNSAFTAEDVAIITATDSTIELITEEREQLPEFIGRFFVKLVRNATFDTNIIDTATQGEDKEYGVIASADVYDKVQPAGPGSMQREFFYDFREEVRWKEGRNTSDEPQTRPQGVGIRVGSNRVDISYSGTEPNGFRNPQWSNEFGDYLGRTGSYIRFVDGGDVYKIISVEHIAGPNLQSRGNRNGPSSTGLWFIGRAGLGTTSFKRWSLTLDREVTAVPTLTEVVSQDINGPDTDTVGSIEILRDITESSRTREGGTPYVSDPAIFETEPTGDDALDIYYETQETFNITEHGQQNTLKWYNCFSFGNGVESDRIRDDFNGVRIDKGPRVSATIAEQFREEHRPSGLIWSGIFNSITGINSTNQFILALGIQKELQPLFGSIQRLHSRDTNLISFCEDKVLRILADKDALFNADGSTNISASNNVLGQTTPFTGEYGISKNPESFATYGHRIYFSDKNRGVILRLSQDGITEISSKGLTDYFRDRFMSHSGPIIGSYDDYHDKFIISFDDYSVAYDESVDGWPSRMSFVPEWGLTLNNRFYTWKNGLLWRHNSSDVSRNNFYGTQHVSSVTFIFNDNPGSVKNFKTISYEGSKPKSLLSYDIDDTPVCINDADGGWFSPTFITDQEVGDARAFIDKEGKWFTDIGVLGGVEAVAAVEEGLDNADVSDDTEDFVDEIEEMVMDDLSTAEGIGPVEEMEEIPDPVDPEPPQTEITIRLT